MDPLIVLGVQCTFSMLTFFLIFKWYVVPHLTKQTKHAVLAVLLLINVFRYLPLSLFMPGQVSADLPIYLKQLIAHGDLLSGVLALVAVLLLKSRSKLAEPAIWLFSIVSIMDMLIVLTMAIKEKVYLLPLGANYFTVSVYVPLLIVLQVLILKMLIQRSYR